MAIALILTHPCENRSTYFVEDLLVQKAQEDENQQNEESNHVCAIRSSDESSSSTISVSVSADKERMPSTSTVPPPVFPSSVSSVREQIAREMRALTPPPLPLQSAPADTAFTSITSTSTAPETAASCGASASGTAYSPITIDGAVSTDLNSPFFVPAPPAPAAKKNGAASNAPTLIVCPLSVLSAWQDQINKHVTPNVLRVLLFHGPNRMRFDEEKLLKYDVVITSYDTVSAEHHNETNVDLTALASSSSYSSSLKKRARS